MTNILCRIFGHKTKKIGFQGINPRTAKVVWRVVEYCKRCSWRSQKDLIIRDFDLKQGVNPFWGSAGMCAGCIHKDDCPESALGKPFVYVRCPVKNFEFTKEGKKKLKQWGDTLLE